MSSFLLLIVLNLVYFCFGHMNNVCENIPDYNNINTNPNCSYDPDVNLRMPKIITYHGYPAEEHKVVTEDGYILTLFRIPYGKNEKPNNSTVRQPVFLQHGLLITSTFWVFAKNSSYGFILADQGYDVWMGNSRGSTYSLGHVNLSTNDVRYWNFSFHEMGFYDIPASLDYVAEKTGRKDIILIGDSLGTNLEYVYASDLPEHAENRTKLLVSLAPTLFYNGAKSILVSFAKYWQIIKYVGDVFQVKAVLPNTIGMRFLLRVLCLQSGLEVFICETVLFLVFGIDYGNFDNALLPVFLANYPAGTSLNTFVQVFQNIDSDRFAHFDYGTVLNMQYYNQATAPDYNISRVTIPAYIFYGSNDWLASPEGAIRLYDDLNSKKEIYKIMDEQYTHMDFYFARNVREQVIYKLLDVLKNYQVTTTV